MIVAGVLMVVVATGAAAVVWLACSLLNVFNGGTPARRRAKARRWRT